jgi:ATP-dependent helicase HrpA
LTSQERQQRINACPKWQYPEALPVSDRADEIAATIRAHQVVIVCGETGSGKTTQLPKICLAAGRGIEGLIGHTQPRRMAARAVATRIAKELNTSLGDAVGFKVRFTDQTSKNAYIKLMTDGILLAEAQKDHLLSDYDTIIVDEAHERSVNIDFLLGLIKQICQVRPELKVIVTSATLDAEKFAQFFESQGKPAPIIEVSGRMYPVSVRYRPLSEALDDDADDEEGMEDAVADTVEELWRGQSGDILVFLPGEREIRETAEALEQNLKARPYAGQMEILPLYARLSVAEQNKIFSESNGRRIVLATNVAETSLTVPGIRYVIDTGLARVKRYSLRNKTTLLHIEKISQAAANQRMGRCGRLSEGICVRLYDEEDFNARPQYTEPELLRSSLADVILKMAALKLGRAEDFSFIDAPAPRAIADGYQLLTELGAMDESGALTKIGRSLSQLPLDPRVGRIVLMSYEKHCLPEALVIAAALSVPDPRDRPFEKQQAADQAHARFKDPQSDFLSFLSIWRWFSDVMNEKLSHRKTVDKCRELFLNYLRLREWRDVHQQLLSTLKEAGWVWPETFTEKITPPFYQALHESLLSGLIANIGVKNDVGDDYQGARGMTFSVHPGSGIKKNAPWVMAAELTETSRLFARCVAIVDPLWIERVCQDRVTREYYDPHWDAKRGEVTGFERVRWYGLTLVGRRPISFARVNPQVAREVFIREAVATGDLPAKYRGQGSFFEHNQKLIENIAKLEDKARRQDVLIDPQSIEQLYLERVPDHVVSLVTFEQWYQDAIKGNPKILYLTREEVMRHAAAWVTEDLFPDRMKVEGVPLPLAYRFEPDHPLDGVTLTLPLPALNKLDAARLSWLVPGKVRDKITWYIKALPKPLRNRLVPIPNIVTAFLEDVTFGEGDLATVFAAWLNRIYRMDIHASVWNQEALPPHLKMHYRITDDENHVLRDGDDLALLRAELNDLAKMSFSDEGATAFEKTDLVSWSFGDLPDHVTVMRHGKKWTAYPMLVDCRKSVSLTVSDTPEAAMTETRKGIIRLIRFSLKDLVSRYERDPKGFREASLLLKTLIPTDILLADVINAVCDRAFIGADALPRNEKSFNEQIKRARTRWTAVAESAFLLLNEIAVAHQQFLTRLNAAPLAWGSLLQALRAQRDALIYPNFFSLTDWDHLTQLPRYLKAMDRRLAKYPERAERDKKHGAQMEMLWARYREREAANQKTGVTEPMLQNYRWMLEEMRVSLFAQELKTAYPISFPRIEKVWQGIVKG